MKRIVLLLALALGASGALAQRTGTVHGIGTNPCGDYLQDRAKNNAWLDASYVNWVLGYMSGYNLYSQHPQVSPLPGGPTILAYLDKRCRDEPLGNVTGGAGDLIGDLGGWKAPKPKK